LSQDQMCWKDILNDEFIKSYCEARPLVTIFNLDMWSILFGDVVWTVDSAVTGAFWDYWYPLYRRFLKACDDYSKSIHVDFNAWFKESYVINVPCPPWIRFDEDYVLHSNDKELVSPKTFNLLSTLCRKDYFSHKGMLWREYYFFCVCPKLPFASLSVVQSDNLTLKYKFNKLFKALILDATCKVICNNLCCKIGHLSYGQLKHVINEVCKCGKFEAYISGYEPHVSLRSLYYDGIL